MGAGGDVMLVRNQNDCVTRLMEAVKQIHDFFASGGIEISGRLIGQDNRGIIDQGTGNRDALPLAPGKLIGAMVHAVAQFHHAKHIVGALTL